MYLFYLFSFITSCLLGEAVIEEGPFLQPNSFSVLHATSRLNPSNTNPIIYSATRGDADDRCIDGRSSETDI